MRDAATDRELSSNTCRQTEYASGSILDQDVVAGAPVDHVLTRSANQLNATFSFGLCETASETPFSIELSLSGLPALGGEGGPRNIVEWVPDAYDAYPAQSWIKVLLPGPPSSTS
jgi:hypothetical protein